MQLVCRHCGWVLDVEADQAGEVVPCPRCGQDVRIPGDGPSDDDLDADAEVGFADQARAAMKRPLRANVTCPRCEHVFTVGLRMCGRSVHCPSCRVPVRIPYPDERQVGASGEPAQPPAQSVNPPAKKPRGKHSGKPGSRNRLNFRQGWVLVLVPVVVLALVGVAAILKLIWS